MANSKSQHIKQNGGIGGVWFLGFIGTLVYFIQYHSGTFWLVLLAFIKALFWPGYLVYYLLRYMGV